MISSVNKNLISLKCVLFAFFAGMGCLIPFLPAHVRAVGLSVQNACLISIIAPCVCILGPLFAGPLADKLSVGRGCEVSGEKSGSGGGNRVLRFMIAACLLLAALFYGLLLAVPNMQILEPRRPSVSFMCDSNGATVFQEMCSEEKACNHWTGEKLGLLRLSECVFTCEKPPVARFLSLNSGSTTEYPLEDNYDNSDDGEPDYGTTVYSDAGIHNDSHTEDSRSNREYRSSDSTSNTPTVDLPHLCHSKSSEHTTHCQVYTPKTKQLEIDTSLLSAIHEEYENNNETSWCKYPLGGTFQCLVPDKLAQFLKQQDDNQSCNPVIECHVDNPYDAADSVLAESQCKLFIGDPDTTFWTYLIFRTLGDLFATSALCLLCTACVIATRETSVGRGDVGRQLAFGIIGMALLPPIIGGIHSAVSDDTDLPPYLVPILVAVILLVIAAIITICASEMPLSPPEWWWHTRTGLLALPMNTVRRYGLETAGVLLVLTILGVFWSALDSYMPWTIKELRGSDLLLSLTVVVAAIPAVPVLWHAERVVDYCGHSNVFIGAFTFYIFRYTGMAVLREPWWILLCEALEVFTLSLMWVTAVLYFRHLVPRKFTSSGQAAPVLAHFCIGRCFGALIGLAVQNDSNKSIPSNIVWNLQNTYKVLAICACVCGLVYLALYHLLLAPCCRAASTGPPAMQGMNGNGNANGNYTPLRVYHNERGRKGQFKY